MLKARPLKILQPPPQADTTKPREQNSRALGEASERWTAHPAAAQSPALEREREIVAGTRDPPPRSRSDYRALSLRTAAARSQMPGPGGVSARTREPVAWNSIFAAPFDGGKTPRAVIRRDRERLVYPTRPRREWALRWRGEGGLACFSGAFECGIWFWIDCDDLFLPRDVMRVFYLLCG